MHRKSKQLISFVLSLFVLVIGGIFLTPSYAQADEITPSITSVTSDGTSSHGVGTPIKWTAEVSGTVTGYQWDIYKDSVKTETLNSTDKFISYTPAAPGKYKVALSIKDVDGNIVKDVNGDPITMSSDEIVVTSNLKIKSVTPNKSGSIALGTSLRWTALADGTGLQYSWSIYKTGVTKPVYTKSLSGSNYIDYKPTAVGTYYAEVTVKDSYGQTAISKSGNSTFTVVPLKIVSVKSDKSGKLNQGTSIKYTVTAQGTGLTYYWKVYRNNKLINYYPYSSKNYLQYTPQLEGTYKVLVYARDVQNKVTSMYSSSIVIYVDVDSLVTPGIVYGTVKGNVSVYSSMSTKAKKVGSLKSGSKVEVVRDSGGKWYYIRTTTGKTVGWVTAASLYIPPDPPTNTKRMTTAQIEKYVNTKSFTSGSKYFIWVDLNRQLAHIFTGSNHKWKLVRTASIASGKNKTPTVRGQFTISARGSWFLSDNPKIGAKNWVRFYGDYMFHSILYYTNGKVASSVLGKRASHGCIRMGINDITWIYKNIPNGTKVFIN